MEYKNLKLNIGLFDVVKSIALILIIFFVWTRFDIIGTWFNKPEQKTEPTIITIEDTAMKAEIVLSKARLEELEKLLKEQDSLILKYAKENKEKIDELAKITAGVAQTVKNKTESDKIYEGKEDKDPNKYYFKKIYMKDAKGKEFPISWVMFYPNRDKDEQWKSGTYPLDFEMNVIEAQKKDGTETRYAELFAKNDQMKETKGELFPIEVKNIQWEKAPLREKSFSFNMRISAYANGMVNSEGEGVFAPGLGVSFFSYGRTDRDMDWKFLGIGGAYDGQEAYAFFEPFAWNAGNVLPVIENFFIGPIGGMNTEGNWSLGVGLSIPF